MWYNYWESGHSDTSISRDELIKELEGFYGVAVMTKE